MTTAVHTCFRARAAACLRTARIGAVGIAVLGIASHSRAALAHAQVVDEGRVQERREQQRVVDEYNALIMQSSRNFDLAVVAEQEGRNSDACVAFYFARNGYVNALWMTLKLRGTYNDEAAQTQRNIDLIDKRRRAVCGKGDTTRPSTAASSAASSATTNAGGSARSSQSEWPDMSSQVRALQTSISTAYDDANESLRLYRASNSAASCAKARASADGYTRARAEAAAILKASGSFRDVGVRDIEALDTNVAQSARDANEVYCKPPRAVANFDAELSAFAAMKSALHLERGTVTPMTMQEAPAMRSACVTDKLYAATQARSAFADALSDACQSFVAMYNMRLPSQACAALKRARTKLARVEPDYATQARQLDDDLRTLQLAFTCDPTAGPTPAPTSGGSTLLKPRANVLPPMKLDIKPLPSRAAQ